MKLLVFGNGFHRWLGLKTKYIHYKNFLIKNKDKFKNFFKILNEITKSCNDDKEWSSLEDDILCWLCKNINKTNPLNDEIKLSKIKPKCGPGSDGGRKPPKPKAPAWFTDFRNEVMQRFDRQDKRFDSLENRPDRVVKVNNLKE